MSEPAQSRQDLIRWLEEIPKVELHLHLEGAIPPESLLDLVNKYSPPSERMDLDALNRRLDFDTFDAFIGAWTWKNRFLRAYEDFTHISRALAETMRRQNIVYAEVFYSPPDFKQHGLQTGRLTEAIRHGFSEVCGVEIMLVADVVRDYGPDRAMQTVEELSDLKSLGVIGIGLGGSEEPYPPDPFQKVFERARLSGLRTTVHAGEADGADSIRAALRTLKADRIGHGTRAHEDPALVEHLAEHRIPLEMCPISNVRTGVVPSLDHHPIRDYFDRGLMVTVNTDDPAMFATTLAGEFHALSESLSFTPEEIRTLVLSGVDATWLDHDRKQALREKVTSHPRWSARIDDIIR